MKKLLIIGLSLFVIGCSTAGGRLETYVDEPSFLIRDPHFDKYQEKRDKLEHRYLNKDITYAEYIEKRNELDDEYEEEVRKRENILSDGMQP